MELLLELLQENPDKRPKRLAFPPRNWVLMGFLDWDIAMPKSRFFFFILASELWIIMIHSASICIYTGNISIISPFIDELSSREPPFIHGFPQWIMEKISQRWIDPEILFSLHPLAIEHRHSYSKMIKMVHLLSMLNKDEHDDLRKDLLYIYNYV